MEYKLYRGGCCMKKKGCCKASDKKLSVHDWLSDLPETATATNLVEVQFKNTRKGYYKNVNNLELQKGDLVAVGASPGHDVGEVTLTGALVLLQMRKNGINPNKYDLREVYRKARESDIEKYNEAKAKEQQTMIKARQIAEGLRLNMKIGDVEYQGDGNKAIFYYIADERVDFRQLIKVFADTFHIRIEMKQIGARQEAGRIGGIGPCGRELCCSGWLTNFNSVSTSSARYQDLSLNPQKLAGQCGKLKCCLNYELDCYLDAQRKLPSREIQLETQEGVYYHFKTDVFKGLLTYSSDKQMASNLVTITAARAREVIGLNKSGQKPPKLDEQQDRTQPKAVDYENVVGQDSVNRFDNQRRNPSKRRKGKRKGGGNGQQQKNKAKNGENGTS